MMGKLLRRLSSSTSSRAGASSGDPSRSNSDTNLTSMAPSSRTVRPLMYTLPKYYNRLTRPVGIKYQPCQQTPPVHCSETLEQA